MTLPTPKLDNRSYAQLVEDARKRVIDSCPEWTDLSAGDPGLTLIEVFAFLTENMLYRLNRVPEKLYVTLLNLVGAQIRPPSAAVVSLRFTRTGQDGDIVIPAGVQVASGDGQVVFQVTDGVLLPKGKTEVAARALHCETIDAEPASLGEGRSFRVRRPPIIAPTGDGLDVVVGVERKAGDMGDAPSRAVGGRAFTVWTAAAGYADAAGEPRRFLVDRTSGLIVFPPAASIEGREIRVWYRRGGGRAGNVEVGELKALKAPGLPVAVTNPAKAAGGADAETLQSAIERSPLESLGARGAVTRRDFERVARLADGIAQARAFPLSEVWRHADPGVVQVLLVPAIKVDSLPERAVTKDVVSEHRVEELRQRVLRLLDERRPLGVRATADWTRVRPVGVSARVVVTQGEDPRVKAAEIRRRLNELFSPFNGQPFGRALRASDAYEAILSEPSVRYADDLRFNVDEAPDKVVRDIVSDPHQARTWFAATDKALHRSLDDGDSWAIVRNAEGEAPLFVRRHPARPGLAVLAVARGGGGAILISRDCGENWEQAAFFPGDVNDAAWTERDGQPLLLIATHDGLRELKMAAGSVPERVAVEAKADGAGYYAVAAAASPSGAVTVVVAAREKRGVFVSAAGGQGRSFGEVAGLKDKDIRKLVVQRYNTRDFLWGGAEAEADEPGDAAYRLELQPGGGASGEWLDFKDGWERAGACRGLAFVERWAFAASDRRGVLTMDTGLPSPTWQAVRIDAGLPLSDGDRVLQATKAIAAGPADPQPLVLAGGAAGVYKSLDGAQRFTSAAQTQFTDRIPLPPNWLYCAAPHDIKVVQEEET